MAKPGRKRRQGVRRTPSGRVSRAGVPAAAEHVAQVEVRMRQHGLSREQAMDQKAGSVVGRWRLKGLLSEAQYLAGQEFLRLYDGFKRAVKAPDALTRGGELGIGDRASGAYAGWCQDAIAAYEAAYDSVLRANGAQRRYNCPAALDLVLVRDNDFEHLRGDLKVALAALVRHFGIVVPEEPAKAA